MPSARLSARITAVSIAAGMSSRRLEGGGDLRIVHDRLQRGLHIFGAGKQNLPS